jgi:bifunctional non-homologous end joining protein LigD
MLPTIEPELLTEAASVPFGRHWIHEIKHDGFRIVAYIEDGDVELISRNGLDWTQRFATISESLKGLKVKDAIFDGEVGVPDEDGVMQFHRIRRKDAQTELAYLVFDLLWLNGKDLRGLPLHKRKSELKKLLRNPVGRVIYADHVEGASGRALFQMVERTGHEGVVSKLRNSPYRSGERTKEWLKIKPPHMKEKHAERMREAFESMGRRRRYDPDPDKPEPKRRKLKSLFKAT